MPKPKIVPFAHLIADFAAYRRDERGLSPATVRNQNWHVEKFLRWLGEQNRSLNDVSLEDVDAFLAANGEQAWGRVSVATSAKALRAFFNMQRYAGGVRPALPPGLTANACSNTKLATYGLRSSEVSGLRLQDVNWESEKVSIARPKQRRAQEYPLVSEAGEAILNYLQKARPRCAQREIFLTSKAPFRRTLPGCPLPSGQHTPERARNPPATPWAALSTPRLWWPPGGRGIFAKGDWRSSRAPQRFCHSYLCQS
jgi:integrase/recombinase XerD